MGVTSEGIDDWFKEFEEYINGIDPTLLVQPMRIFNADETAFPIAPKPSKVIAEVGLPNVYARGSNSKQALTVMVGANASGCFLPPMVVYPGRSFYREFMQHFFEVLPGSEFASSDNGWMDRDLFETWLRDVFNPAVTRMRIHWPVLLIVDRAQVHLGTNASVFCETHGIILYILYPNATHLMQPMDLTLMGPLKQHYRECVRTWIHDNTDKTYDKYAFPEVFAETWRRVASLENGCKGFRKAGLYPLNRQAIPEHKLVSTIRDEPAEVVVEMLTEVIVDIPEVLPEVHLPEVTMSEAASVPEAQAEETVTPVPDVVIPVPEVTRLPEAAQVTVQPVQPKRKKFVVPRKTGEAIGTVTEVSRETFNRLRIPDTIVKGGRWYGLYDLGPLQPRTQEDVIRDVLRLPSGRQIQKTKGGARVSGLPRAVSSREFREAIEAKEKEKQKLVEEREERKRKKQEEKVEREQRKQEEKRMKQMEREEKRQERQREKECLARERQERQWERQEEAALESLRKSYRNRKPVKRFIEESDSESSIDFELESDEMMVSDDLEESDQETDDESIASQESMEYHEGSTNWCAKCEKKFDRKAAEKAIGCEGVYCCRWYHRGCSGLAVQGKSEKEIRKIPFKCALC